MLDAPLGHWILKMKIELEGIPNKAQTICLTTLAIYALSMIVSLCINAPKITDISARLRYCLPWLIVFVIFVCITLLVCYYFPNIKELKSKFIKTYRFMEEFGYHCESSYYSKKDKTIEYRYTHNNFAPVVFILHIRRGTAPYFVTSNEEYVNMWLFLEYLDEDIADVIEDDDAFKQCMEIMTDYMRAKPVLFSKELEDCKNLTFDLYRMPDSRSSEYCLGCYYGSCFIDFNIKNELVFLERISCDGLGCFEISNPEATLTAEESELFKAEMKKNYFSQKVVRPLVLKLINLNENLICEEVFDKYPLLRINT